jgi:hypothetical protein
MLEIQNTYILLTKLAKKTYPEVVFDTVMCENKIQQTPGHHYIHLLLNILKQRYHPPYACYIQQ